MQIGIWQLVIILVIVMLLFGATQIPRLMRGLGQGVTEFKKGLQEGAKEETASKEPDKKEPGKSDSEKPAS